MAVISTSITTDEITWQKEFYKILFGEDSEEIIIDRNTDGYTRGIIFEHKTNIQSYGESKALSQALIYLTRFNRDGVPVPAKICLVGQEEQKCYIYDTINYIDIINDIEKYANIKASEGIPGFVAGARSGTISFNLSNPLLGMQEILKFVQKRPETVKININFNNVYGWSGFYYSNARIYNQKPEKKAFFNELKNPVGTLKEFINPWTGEESDFKLIMDILNDPETQKDLGAFYTPPLYAKKAVELVRKAIARVPKGNDYIILDRCAGTGSLEFELSEEELSHVIVNTYELKEWIVLKDRFGKRVRYIIPPIPSNPTQLPQLNDNGFLRGANALERDIIDNKEVRKYLNNPHCSVILFENPPFVESSQVVKKDGKTIVQKKKSTWKHSYMAQKMAEDVSGPALNDMGNVFIWSGFKHFLRYPTDSYVVFSPIKYWKAHHLINKKFLGGFAFNRKHFHADSSCVTCIYWSNESDKMTHNITLKSFNIENEKLICDEDIVVNQVFTTFSDKYFDTRNDSSDSKGGIVCEINGKLSTKEPIGIIPLNNSNILAYLVAYKNTFDSPRYCSMLLRGGIYNGHGFYLRTDNFVKKLPLFAASRYTDYCNDWKVMSMVMKSADKAEQFEIDASSGRLDKFLCQCMIWTCLTHYAHMRSFNDENKVLYKNELCFDNLDGKSTFATKKLMEYIANGYEFTEQEKILFKKWNNILHLIHNTDEYVCEYNYGLFQIDEDINIKIPQGVKPNGKPNMITKYGDLNNHIKDMKKLLKQYYIDNIVDKLFEYEFLK